MKKFLVGVIFLIPIVVVIALSATGAIISLTTPVNPSGMVIKNSDNVELDKNSVVKVDSRDNGEFIVIDVLPAITQDKAITYERIEEAGSGVVELEQIGESNRYSIVPKNIGVTKLEIRAKANVNVYKEVTFYVSSDSVEEMMIYDKDGRDVGEYLEITKNIKLFVDINPVDAVRNNDIQWSSSNTSVLKVSPNGELYVEGRGIARIKVTVVDKDGNTVSEYVDVDTSKAVIKKEKVYVSEAVGENYIKDNFVLDKNATVTKVNDGKFEVVSASGVFTIVTEIVGADEWDITELPEVMYLRNGGYTPVCVSLVSDEPLNGVEIGCSDASLIEYQADAELLVPLATGKVTVIAVYNGVTKSKEIILKDNPIAFELEQGTADQKLGIQLDRTYGIYWLTEQNTLTTEYKFGLADKSNTFDVVWSVNDYNFVDITPVEGTQDIILDFKEASEGQAVTVTATLKIYGLEQTRVRRSFTFKIRQERNSVNVYNFEQAKWVKNYRFYNMVLQSDIYATEILYEITASVYGNGFKWDGTAISSMAFDDGALRFTFEDFVNLSRRGEYKANYELFVSEGNDTINFEDMIMFNANSIKEAEKRGAGIRVKGLWNELRESFNDFPRELPINLRYLQLYNMHRGLHLDYYYDVVVEGCILGDNSDTNVFANYYSEKQRRYPNDNNLTFRNNVFKITSGPSVLIATSAVDSDIDSSCNSAPNLKFEGFNDFYNWKTKEEFIESFTNLIASYVGMFVGEGELKNAIDTLLLPILKDVVLDVSKSDAIQDLYYNYAGKQYLSFGALGLGTLFLFDASNITIESEGLMLTDLPFRDNSGKPAGRLSGLEALLNSLNEKVGIPNATTLCNPSPIVCTDFSSGDPKIQPGDPIPNSKDLYDKLRGNAK